MRKGAVAIAWAAMLGCAGANISPELESVKDEPATTEDERSVEGGIVDTAGEEDDAEEPDTADSAGASDTTGASDTANASDTATGAGTSDTASAGVAEDAEEVLDGESAPLPEDGDNDPQAEVPDVPQGGDATNPPDVPEEEDNADVTAAYRPACIERESQVVAIGDSYMDWPSHNFKEDLIALSGMKFRYHAQGGASLGSGGLVGLIGEQLWSAVDEDADIRVVIMTGGANDVMIPATTWTDGDKCKNSEEGPEMRVCQDIVRQAVDRALAMMEEAVRYGITDVVYFFYPHVPDGTLLGGLHPNAMLDYAVPIVRDTCDSVYDRTDGAMRCHFIDLMPVFEGKSGLFAPTDVHPSPKGSALIAETVWTLMQEECLGQPVGSECCSRPTL